MLSLVVECFLKLECCWAGLGLFVKPGVMFLGWHSVFPSLLFFVPWRISVFLTVKWEDDCSQTEKGKEKTCVGTRPTLCCCYNFWNGAQVRKFQLHFWSGIHQGAGEWYQEVLPYVTIFERSYSFRFVHCFLSILMGYFVKLECQPSHG